MKPSVRKMMDLYRNIRNDLTELFNDDPMSKSVPRVSRRITSVDFKLKELYMCLGQLLGYVLGKMIELTS